MICWTRESGPWGEVYTEGAMYPGGADRPSGPPTGGGVKNEIVFGSGINGRGIGSAVEFSGSVLGGTGGDDGESGDSGRGRRDIPNRSNQGCGRRLSCRCLHKANVQARRTSSRRRR